MRFVKTLVFALAILRVARAAVLNDFLSKHSLAAAPATDAHCKTGIISLKYGSKPQSCCPSYCGACNDYKTCKSVRGQNSENACCASKVYDMRCGKAPANVCLKTCSESTPPCIMDIEAKEVQEVRTFKGVPPCNEVIPHVRQMHTAAIDKANLLIDLHVTSAKLQEALRFAHTAQTHLKDDGQDSEIPKSYKEKIDAELKRANLVIGHAEKEILKVNELNGKLVDIKSGEQIPRDLKLSIQGVLLEARKDDKKALASTVHADSLHVQAYHSIAEIAEEKAREAAEKVRVAAEEKAKMEAAAKAAKEAAAKAAAEKKAAKEAAAKAAAEAAAKAAAAKKAAEEAAAKAAMEAEKAKKKIPKHEFPQGRCNKCEEPDVNVRRRWPHGSKGEADAMAYCDADPKCKAIWFHDPDGRVTGRKIANPKIGILYGNGLRDWYANFHPGIAGVRMKGALIRN